MTPHPEPRLEILNSHENTTNVIKIDGRPLQYIMGPSKHIQGCKNMHQVLSLERRDPFKEFRATRPGINVNKYFIVHNIYKGKVMCLL